LSVCFFTGFPGFITGRLLRELLTVGHSVNRIYLLVLPEMLGKAERMLSPIREQAGPTLEIILLPGDITRPDLGLDETRRKELSLSVTHVFHLAAVYDLAVPEDVARRVNVVGTHHVNEWVKTLDKLERYVYFSTAYVSGTREGRIFEHELDMGQSFKNHYESTKFEAEVLVQKLIPDWPVTVIRPGIVKGDSATGETIKFDGPYFMLNFFDRLRFLPFIPHLGKDIGAVGNFVPVDYIAKATLHFAFRPESAGKTYHLTDPSAYSMHETYAMLMEAYLGKKPVGRIPLPLVKATLSSSAVRRWLRVEKEAIDYFTFRAIYDSTQAQKDLEGSGIRLPDFRETVGPMVEFYRKHKNDVDKHLVIR
jgi:thioester reductase-like protein